jgi:hypothetical protein
MQWQTKRLVEGWGLNVFPSKARENASFKDVRKRGTSFISPFGNSAIAPDSALVLFLALRACGVSMIHPLPSSHRGLTCIFTVGH